MELSRHLNIGRSILVVLIAISLALAPGASAFAGARAHGSPIAALAHNGAHHDMTSAMTMDEGATAGPDAIGIDVSDCMKAMQGNSADGSKSGCKCCDGKSSCPDQSNCMTKCCKVIGAPKAAGATLVIASIQYHLAAPAKPPDWLNTPPAPPPRT